MILNHGGTFIKGSRFTTFQLLIPDTFFVLIPRLDDSWYSPTPTQPGFRWNERHMVSFSRSSGLDNTGALETQESRGEKHHKWLSTLKGSSERPREQPLPALCGVR